MYQHPHLAGVSDICRPKSSVALFQQATALEPRTSSFPRGAYPDRKVDVRSAWLTVGNRRELGLGQVWRRGPVGSERKLVGIFEPVRASVFRERCLSNRSVVLGAQERRYSRTVPHLHLFDCRSQSSPTQHTSSGLSLRFPPPGISASLTTTTLSPLPHTLGGRRSSPSSPSPPGKSDLRGKAGQPSQRPSRRTPVPRDTLEGQACLHQGSGTPPDSAGMRFSRAWVGMSRAGTG